MSAKASEILAAFPDLLVHLKGNLDIEVTGPSSQTHPALGTVVFVSEKEHLSTLSQSGVALIVAHKSLEPQLGANHQTVFLSPNPYLAMALVNQQFFPVPHHRKSLSKENIHPSAVIHPSAKLHPSVCVGPNTVIYGDVHIGEGTFIGANCVIEANVTIGKNCFIHHMVFIGHTSEIGNAVEIKPNSSVGTDGFGYAHDEKGNHYRLPHYGKLIIEDDVHIGANVNVDRGTFEPAKIGRGTKIDNHCHFGHNVQVGENCLITAGFIVAGSTKIGSNCVFAGRVSVNGHIELTDKVTLGALSAATNDIKEPGAYLGYPPIPFRQGLKVNSSLASLPRLRKNMSQVMKHLGLSEE